MMAGMRAVVQRVIRAEVRVEGRAAGRIGRGLLVLVAVGGDDRAETARALAEKIVGLRVFDNQQGRMDRSLAESGGDLLCVPEFTLYGDCRKGRRPNYQRAAAPEKARPLFDAFVGFLREFLPAGARVATGQFQAMMEVESVNDGPVTLLLDWEEPGGARG
jgi:D-aminoacyl-tRNA deacylase